MSLFEMDNMRWQRIRLYYVIKTPSFNFWSKNWQQVPKSSWPVALPLPLPWMYLSTRQAAVAGTERRQQQQQGPCSCAKQLLHTTFEFNDEHTCYNRAATNACEQGIWGQWTSLVGAAAFVYAEHSPVSRKWQIWTLKKSKWKQRSVILALYSYLYI